MKALEKWFQVCNSTVEKLYTTPEEPVMALKMFTEAPKNMCRFQKMVHFGHIKHFYMGPKCVEKNIRQSAL